MPKNGIIIGEPYVINPDDKHCRLCSDIINDGEVKTLYYEFDKEYKDYLNIDNSDTFVLGLLHNAMFEDKDLICLGGVSSRILFQLNNYYIPVVGKKMPDLNVINVFSNQKGSVCGNKPGAMTGCSGGVDSFFSILKYQSEQLGDYSLTHVMFNNISTADYDEARIKKLFLHDKNEKSNIAKELNLKSVIMYTNLYCFYKSQFIFNFYFAAQYISAAYAMGRLLDKYYYSSAYPVSHFLLDSKNMKDGSSFDLFSINCFSSDYITVYLTGSEVTRFEKTKFICNNSTVKKHLQVCSEEQYSSFYLKGKALQTLNCGTCKKCMRTITTLYGLGVLDNYKEVFDLSVFNKNKERFIACELAYDLKEFSVEIERSLKNANLNKFKVKLFLMFYKLKHALRSIKILKKIYSFLVYHKLDKE